MSKSKIKFVFRFEFLILKFGFVWNLEIRIWELFLGAHKNAFSVRLKKNISVLVGSQCCNIIFLQ